MLPTRRKEAHKGIRFTMLLVGEAGTGKTTFVNALLDQKILDHRYSETESWERSFVPLTAHEEPGISITETLVEIIDEDDLKLLLSLIDTPGFGLNTDNEVCFTEIIGYLKQQFDRVLAEETKVRRNPRFVDTRVHVCLYFITPTGHGLRELDVECMKKLAKYVNVLPVVARADSFTPAELKQFKKTIMEDIDKYNVPVFEFNYDQDEDDYDVIQEIEFLNRIQPFAVIALETVLTKEDGTKFRGRQYPWGTIDIDDALNSDFPVLRSVLLGSHLQDLKDLTHDFLYENYRTERLSQVQGLLLDEGDTTYGTRPPPLLLNLAALAGSESGVLASASGYSVSDAPATPREHSSIFGESNSPVSVAKNQRKTMLLDDGESAKSVTDSDVSEATTRRVRHQQSSEFQPHERQNLRILSETLPYELNKERIEQQKLKLQQLEERQVRELQQRAEMLERKAKELKARERALLSELESETEDTDEASVGIKKDETLTDLHLVVEAGA